MGKVIVEENFIRYTKELEQRLANLQRGITADYALTQGSLAARQQPGIENMPRYSNLIESATSLRMDGSSYVIFIRPPVDTSFRYIEFYTTFCYYLQVDVQKGMIGVYYGDESTFSANYPYYPTVTFTKSSGWTNGSLIDTGLGDVLQRQVVDMGSEISLRGGIVHAVGIAFEPIGSFNELTSKPTVANTSGYYISLLCGRVSYQRPDTKVLNALPSTQYNQFYSENNLASDLPNNRKPVPLIALDAANVMQPEKNIMGVPYVRLV